jgi:surface antigen
MQRDDNYPNAGLVDGHGLVLPANRRREAVLRSKALGMTPAQYVYWLLDRDLASVGLVPGAPAYRLGPDNGDEYGQRVVTHTEMVRGMGNG